MRSLLVLSYFSYTTMALVENGKVIEYFMETAEDRSTVGRIFKGQISNTVKSLDAAFVDIGDEKGFLTYRDHRKQPIVNQQLIMCQVVALADGEKAPRLTDNISLTGAYFIYMPMGEKINVSGKIRRNNRMDEVCTRFAGLNTENMQGIIRAAAVGATDEQIQTELRTLRELWQQIQRAYADAPVGAQVFGGDSLFIRAYTNLADQDIDEIVVNDISLFDCVRERFGDASNDFFARVKVSSQLNIFKDYGIYEQLKDINNPRVDMHNGGYLIIDDTEALTVIDVNSGGFLTEKDLANTAFRMNVEAVPYIATEIRKRNMGGIIIIDFIDMYTPQHKEQLLAALTEAVNHDRIRVKVTGMTKQGLVELTRAKTKPSVKDRTTQICSHCEGRGYAMSLSRVAMHAFMCLIEKRYAIAGHICVRLGTGLFDYVAVRLREDAVLRIWIDGGDITIVRDESLDERAYII